MSVNGLFRETFALGLAFTLHLGLLLWNPVVMQRSTFFPRLDPLVDIDLIEEQASKAPEPAEGPSKSKGFLKSVKDLLKASRPEQPAPPAPAPRPRLAPLEFSAPAPRSTPAEELTGGNHPEDRIQLAAQSVQKSPTSGPQLKEVGYGVRIKDIPVATVHPDELSGALPSGTIAIPIGPISAKQALEHPPQSARQPASLSDMRTQMASLPRAGGVTAAPSPTELATAGIGGIGAKSTGITGPRPSFELAGPLGDRRITAKVIPTYPEWAIAEGVAGEVQLYFMVNTQGVVQSDYIRVVRTSGSPRLDQWAIQALNQWRFAPSSVQEETQWGMITFHFTLK